MCEHISHSFLRPLCDSLGQPGSRLVRYISTNTDSHKCGRAVWSAHSSAGVRSIAFSCRCIGRLPQFLFLLGFGVVPDFFPATPSDGVGCSNLVWRCFTPRRRSPTHRLKTSFQIRYYDSRQRRLLSEFVREYRMRCNI